MLRSFITAATFCSQEKTFAQAFGSTNGQSQPFVPRASTNSPLSVPHASELPAGTRRLTDPDRVGTVSVPPGIACPGDCSEVYVDGTGVALTATPDPLYHLVAWSGDCTGAGACSVTMTADRSVGATFDSMPFLDGFESGDAGRWTIVVP